MYFPFRRSAALFLLIATLAAAPSRLDQVVDLQRQGRFKEARELLLPAISALRASGDTAQLARALAVAGQISVALGDYDAALREAGEARDLHRRVKDSSREQVVAEEFNTLGLANQYLGKYPEALDNFERALDLYRQQANAQGEITDLNNIGNIYYFQGRYLDALRTYQTALARVDDTSAEKWNPRRRQLTIANLATLYQRLGKEQQALDYYRQLTLSPQAMPPSEQAQLLLNEGVLYRRMGDPVKALESYRASQALFNRERHRDGEIGALRNIGIARAVDLGDLAGALEAFTAALDLARQSSNTRGVVQAALYRAEVLRRMQRLPAAASDARMALDGAQKTGLLEEQWKALYGLGRIADAEGRAVPAAESYRAAIAIIESMRAGLRQAALRSEFLADKRDVYDALIALLLRAAVPSAKEVFGWMERSRARALVEGAEATASVPEATLETVQARLPANTQLLDYWVGENESAVLWITVTAAGVARLRMSPAGIQGLLAAITNPAADRPDEWRRAAQAAGSELLSGITLGPHLIVVPDGPLAAIPFETLVVPGSPSLLIEKCDVTYLPSAQFLTRPRPDFPGRRVPWRRELVAFGDPPVAPDTLSGDLRWQPLSASAGEVQAIARLLPGRAEIHLGVDARKAYLQNGRLAGVPIVHFSTHALVDLENSQRSRILLAPDAPGMPSNYIFEGEVRGLDLHGVDLVTVSACDTARGGTVRGEGLESFSRAFLAAGAGATLTSMWKVADQPAADFMTQFYYVLARGESKAAALRASKLRFLRSNTTLAEPRYWAAFVLNGDGWNASPLPISWTILLLVAAAILATIALAFISVRQRQKPRPLKASNTPARKV